MTIMHSEAETGDVRADVIHRDPALIQNLEQHGSSLECNKYLTHHITTVFPSQWSCVTDLRTLRIFL